MKNIKVSDKLHLKVVKKLSDIRVHNLVEEMVHETKNIKPTMESALIQVITEELNNKPETAAIISPESETIKFEGNIQSKSKQPEYF